eukprot:2664227-Prymnesium_polylepis.1
MRPTPSSPRPRPHRPLPPDRLSPSTNLPPLSPRSWAWTCRRCRSPAGPPRRARPPPRTASPSP